MGERVVLFCDACKTEITPEERFVLFGRGETDACGDFECQEFKIDLCSKHRAQLEREWKKSLGPEMIRIYEKMRYGSGSGTCIFTSQS